MNDLSGKLILITGASSGLGKAISQKTSSLGARVVLLGRNEKRLKETLDSLSGEGHSYYSIDITKYELLNDIIDGIVNSSGPISGFVHCAGIDKTIPFRLSKPPLFKEIFEINVFAAFEIARIISQKKYLSPKGGSYVFLSSVLGKLGESGEVAYSASKSALLSGVKSMALELSEKMIRCNCILPGCIETDMLRRLFNSIPVESKENIIKMHPLGIGKPADVAALVSFLLSDEGKWITGAEYIIDGGYSIH